MSVRELVQKIVVLINILNRCIEESTFGPAPVDDKDPLLIGWIKEYPGWWQLMFLSFGG